LTKGIIVVVLISYIVDSFCLTSIVLFFRIPSDTGSNGKGSTAGSAIGSGTGTFI
jgi:hypothetical protein